MAEPATEKQIAYIKSLGGEVPPKMTKEQASLLIDDLKDNIPATEKQLAKIRKLGVEPPAGLLRDQASEMIDELIGKQPPTKSHIQGLEEFGVAVPATRAEAMELLQTLRKTSPATERQRERAAEMGLELPDGTGYYDAAELIDIAERDSDPEEGKPPSPEALDRIKQLGGDVGKATNVWRAEEYLEELEDAYSYIVGRAEEILEADFSAPGARDAFDVKKPSKAIMIEAIKYGDAQWQQEWENTLDSRYDRYFLISSAIYAVAPQLLKKDCMPPVLTPIEPSEQNGGKATPQQEPQQETAYGCLILIGLLAIALLAFLIYKFG